MHRLSLLLALILTISFNINPLLSKGSAAGNDVSVISVQKDQTSVYEKAKSSSKKVKTLKKGEEFPLLSSTKDYYQILLLNNQRGWIQKSKGKLKTVKRVVMGWNAFGTTDTYIRQGSVSPYLNVVSPRGFTLSETELVAINIDKRYIDWAHQTNRKVWILFGNKFDPVLTQSIIGNTAKRKQAVKMISDALIANQADGINVDFENIDPKNKKHFVDLVRDLRDQLSKHNILVSVDVTRENPDPFWSGSFDRRELGKVADYVVIMAYEEHWATSPNAGSIASLPWVEKGIQLLIKDVPAHKIILGVPFFTREWVTDPVTNKVTGIDRSMNAASQIVANKGLIKQWDAAARQNYVEFSENGVKHQIWLEDEKSMANRIELVKKYHLNGIAAWYLGQENKEIWNLFQALH